MVLMRTAILEVTLSTPSSAGAKSKLKRHNEDPVRKVGLGSGQ